MHKILFVCIPNILKIFFAIDACLYARLIILFLQGKFLTLKYKKNRDERYMLEEPTPAVDKLINQKNTVVFFKNIFLDDFFKNSVFP